MKDKNVSVLYVDDDQHNLNSFKAAFRRKYNIFLAVSAAEGMNILEKKDIHVVIADYKMPGKNGVEFLQDVLQKFPKPVRVIMTAYADIKAVISAINEGQVYRFISKPWSEEELTNTIENAYERYQTFELLKKKNDELQKSYDELDKFVYSASHDLTAPLTSILGIIKVAQMDPKDPNKYFTMIEKSVHKLQSFVKNIIDYHRNTRLEPEGEPINFEVFLKETKETFKYFPGSDKIDISIFVDQERPFYADKERLQIVLNNLLSNAIKYAADDEKSFIYLSASVKEDEVVLIIEDNGIGISPEHLEKIFEMFFRASHSNAGTGIGLYIVQEVVKKLNGRIDVESEKGSGTKFVIHIPEIKMA